MDDMLVEIFKLLSGNILASRPIGYDKHLDLKPGPTGTHQPGSIKRNRVAILYHHLGTDKFFGYDWIGVSGAADLHGRSLGHIKVLHAEDDDVVNVKPIFGTQDDVFLEKIFNHEDGHGKCSEVAILNGLHHYISLRNDEHGNFPEGKFNLYILTERIPCRACAQMLKVFSSKYKDTVFHIGYMFDIMDENVARDVATLKQEIAGLHRIFKVQLISSKDNGYVDSSRLPQWSPKDVGTFPWQEENSGSERACIMHLIEETGQNPLLRKVNVTDSNRAPGQPSVHFSSKILTSRDDTSQ